MKKIGVLSGGISSEREVSLRSGKNVARALINLGYTVIMVDPSIDKIPEEIDFAYNALHGGYGENGVIQGLLEMKGIPYTGSGVIASALTFDKLLTKDVLKSNNLPSADYLWIKRSLDIENIKSFPVVIKPALEGSSIGVSIVDNKGQLYEDFNSLSLKYDRIFVEDFLQGREITVSIVGDKIFPILELKPKKRFYDYEAKYTSGMTDFILPARFDLKLEKQIKDIALKAYNIFMCKGAVRVDMIVTPKGPYILELNTSPGMTDQSDLPAQAKAAGFSFEDLVKLIIESSK